MNKNTTFIASSVFPNAVAQPKCLRRNSLAFPVTLAQPRLTRRHSLYESFHGRNVHVKNRADLLLKSSMKISKSQNEMLKQCDLDLNTKEQHISEENFDCNPASHFSPPKQGNEDINSSLSDQGISDASTGSMVYNGWRVTMEAFQCGLVSSKKCCCCSTELLFFVHAQAVVCPACESILGIELAERKKMKYEVARDLVSVSFASEEKVLLCELSWTASSQLLFLQKEYNGLALGLTKEMLTDLILEPFL